MRGLGRNFLGQVVRLTFALSLAVVLVVASGWAQNRPQVSLETSETLFTVLTAINTCGYDQELNVSDPLRAQIRSDVAKAVEKTAGAQDVIGPMCLFYRQHQTADPARDLSQYVSLALYLDDPPTFTLKVKAAELPPDAAVAADIVPLLQAFYQKIGIARHLGAPPRALHGIDRDLSHSAVQDDIRHRDLSEDAVGGLSGTAVYRLSGCDGRAWADQRAQLCLGLLRGDFADLRHGNQDATDSAHVSALSLWIRWRLKNAGSFKPLEPLLVKLQDAPMDEAFKSNISLLVTECLVRAIEERLSNFQRQTETMTISQADKEGYVLTRLFL